MIRLQVPGIGRRRTIKIKMIGRILGLDIGEKRIGVALSDPSGILASPLTQISRTGTRTAIEAILQLVRQHEVEHIVAGLPYSMDGSLGQQAELVQDFLQKLSLCLEIPVETWDERLSTVAAERLMAEAGVGKERRKKRVDAAAAALILQGYLDRQRADVGTEL
jgi:putative Holliday junction resolvase